MNIHSITKLAIYGLFFSCSISFAQAENSRIPKVNEADFQVLAQDAKKENKQLMILYYRRQCIVCEQFAAMQENGDPAAKKLTNGYKIYKTDVAAGFDVTCPSGETFSEDEFMAMKGITTLPAVVITDAEGNVEVVANEIINDRQLMAIGERSMIQNVAEQSSNRR